MKSRSSLITKELVGRTVLVHNGRYWIPKEIKEYFYINRSIGSLNKTDTRVMCIYGNKKRNKNRKKKKSKQQKKKKNVS